MKSHVTMRSSAAQPNSADRGANAGFLTKLGGKARRFGKSSDGAAAVEFAFVLPIMLTLYFGTMEISQGLEVNKKAGRASSLIADLITQQAVVSKAEIVAIADIAEATLQPYGRDTPIVEVVGIQITDEAVPKAIVAWSQRVTSGSGASFLSVGSITSVPSELLIRNTFLVKGGLRVNYYPASAYTISTSVGGKKGIAMGEHYFLRPRTSPTVSCSGC